MRNIIYYASFIESIKMSEKPKTQVELVVRAHAQCDLSETKVEEDPDNAREIIELRAKDIKRSSEEF